MPMECIMRGWRYVNLQFFFASWHWLALEQIVGILTAALSRRVSSQVLPVTRVLLCVGYRRNFHQVSHKLHVGRC
jgi:hypothetical protein